MRWSYGMTSCKEREGGKAFHQTLCELDKAGFKRDQIKIFVDGERGSAYGVVGNWILSMWELFLTNPKADMYALFQDDILCCPNLKTYIEKSINVHREVYLNLYTTGSNFKFISETNQPPLRDRWYASNQMGRGAMALVFPRPVLFRLLSSENLMAHVQSPNGTMGIDKAINSCLKPRRVQELVHCPSLVQHLDEHECPSTLKKAAGRVSPCFSSSFNPMEDE